MTSLSPRQKMALRTSLGLIARDPAKFATLFYDRLFTLDPTAQSMFTHDMERQGQKLVQMLAFCVKYLDDSQVFLPEVRAMARRHVGYGVVEAQYRTVGETLLWALENALEEAYTADMLAAWRLVYEQIMQIAVEAAYHEPSDSIEPTENT